MERNLYCRAGDWVEVRSREEILATLDNYGTLEGFPFMPEMLPYCGQRFRVYKRADKTCDPANPPWTIRRVKHAVHLEGVRCNGSGHGGCEAGCMIFWNEAWLRRVEENIVPTESLAKPSPIEATNTRLCTVEEIWAASQRGNAEGEVIYTCQATQIRKFTSSMKWWNPLQYIRDIRSRNLADGLARDYWSERALEFAISFMRVLRSFMMDVVNVAQQRVFHRSQYPFIGGTLEKTPIEILDLQPGELVEVKSREEITNTLDKNQKNRGLWFDSEMLPYCGGIYRVLRRVHHIIDEKTGKMTHMKYPCIVLEGVICRSDYHRLCPRAIFIYWRESWLKRAIQFPVKDSAVTAAEISENK
jgi:hypothetical protein